MSRVPQTPSRSAQKLPLRTPTTPTSRSRTASPLTIGPATPRARTKSVPKSPSRSATRKTPPPDVPLPKIQLSIREAIALKRAEAKKSLPKAAPGGLDGFENLEDASPVSVNTKADDDVIDLGRWSVRETIERARNTGDW